MGNCPQVYYNAYAVILSKYYNFSFLGKVNSFTTVVACIA